MTTTTHWKKDLVFEASQEGAGSITMDGNRVEGMSPKALLLAGLSGCSAVDVVEILQKMRVPFSDLTVHAQTEQTDEHPKVFKDILLIYRLKTAAENEDKLRKAIDLSMDKYCGVAAMLRKNSPIQYRLEIIS